MKVLISYKGVSYFTAEEKLNCSKTLLYGANLVTALTACRRHLSTEARLITMIVRMGFLISRLAPRQIHDVSFFANVLYSSFIRSCCYRPILGCSTTQINNKLLSLVSTSKDMFQLPFEISLQILACLSLVSLHNEANSSVFLAPKRLIAFLAGDTVFFFSYFFFSFIMFTLSDSLSRRQEKWY